MKYQLWRNLGAIVGGCLVVPWCEAQRPAHARPDSASAALTGQASADPWQAAAQQAQLYADCGRHARALLDGWLRLKRDPRTQLYSKGGEWNYANEAADHYASLVLIAHHLDPALNEGDGTLRRTLLNSIRLCETTSGLPCSYDLRTFAPGKVDLGGVCEWLRDGLLRITDLMGADNDWYRELVRLTDALLAEAARQGGIQAIAPGSEDAGNLLQVLARLAAMSGDLRYLEAAEELADSYLLDGDPLAKLPRFTFVDHGCEIVPGLAELFLVECRLNRPRAAAYREPLQQLLDRLLEVGRYPESGLWYCHANLRGPQPAGQGQPKETKKPGLSGARFNPDVPHCWGYVLFAYENFDRATGGDRYRAAIEKPMRYLSTGRKRFDALKETQWPWTFSRGCYGDSYESMIILWNRYRDVPRVEEWLDWTTLQAGFRRNATPEYGPGAGAHDDGCTGRNLCAHMMLQSRGIRAVPFVAGLGCGAISDQGGLCIVVTSKSAWSGRLLFDGPRNAAGPVAVDWARINEMPQWFVVRPELEYVLQIDGEDTRSVAGTELIGGVRLELPAGRTKRIELRSKR